MPVDRRCRGVLKEVKVMKKKEMVKRIRCLEDQLRRMDGKRQMEVKVIQNMAKRLNLDLDELLRGDGVR